jgi:glycosidase
MREDWLLRRRESLCLRGSNLKLKVADSNHWLEIDDKSGLLIQIGRNDSQAVTVEGVITKVVFEVGGLERRAATGGLEYFDTKLSSDVRQIAEPILVYDVGWSGFKVPVTFGDIEGFIIYKFNESGPAISIAIELLQSKIVVRNIHLEITFQLEEREWALNLPGNGLRANIALGSLTEDVGVSPLGGLRGSAAIIHISSEAESLVLWPDNEVEIPEILFSSFERNTARLAITSNFGSDLSLIDSIELAMLSFDTNFYPWREFPKIFAHWLKTWGITSPANPPQWVGSAMIFEAQVGFSVFSEVNHYSPYPQVRDLINDLNRIFQLGFTCIQLMPKQPYPSYNVHDYADIGTSYGDIVEIKELIKKAHKLGIKVIFDVLLHGVLDKEIIKVAADGVRSGPYNSLLKGATSDSFSSDVKDWTNYEIAWSRHILDFEPYWLEYSPAKSKLELEHPDWFYRDSAGGIIGVYTKAFDARNLEWQDYFTDSMLYLLKELDIDGFRFDAPTYNDFYNWAPWSRSRASASALACTGLFERMRPIFKKQKADFLFYTEPSGMSLRKSMDLNYNYDEQWLVTSLGSPGSQKAWGIRGAKDLATWVQERDRFLPNGSMTAHHIDSHDTFWWPSWGKKWRREQFDISKVKLLTLIFGSLPGPFMMFSGGEIGIEQLLPKLATVKRSKIWLTGEITWWTSESVPDGIFAISRKLDDQVSATLVNFTDKELSLKNDGAYQLKSVPLQIGQSIVVDPAQIKVPPFSGAVVEFEIG